MTTTFILNQTYQISDEESREIGEYSDSGYDFENETFTLDELRDHALQVGFIHLSDNHPTSKTYITSEPNQDRDFFEKGIERTASLHLVKIIDTNGNEVSSETTDKMWSKLLDEFSGKKKEPEPESSFNI